MLEQLFEELLRKVPWIFAAGIPFIAIAIVMAAAADASIRVRRY